jgi:hypothetical protein
MNAKEANAWRNANKAAFYEHVEKWVAFSPKYGIIGTDISLKVLVEKLNKIGFSSHDFVLKFVHPSELPYKMKMIFPVRIYGIRKKEWSPDYSIGLKHGEILYFESMLIDSGADISCIAKHTGDLLGLQLADGEILNEVGGVGGGLLKYALRKLTFIIDEHEVQTPVAWLQDGSFNELIVGREVIFDEFDIEFKQAEEKIIFKKRSSDITYID